MKNSLVTRNAVAVLGSAFLLAGCIVQGPSSRSQYADNKNRIVQTRGVAWRLDADMPLTERQMQQGLFRMIVIRPQDNMPASTAANVYINSDYRASLFPNSFSEIVTCEGENVLTAALSQAEADRGYPDKTAIRSIFRSKSGETRYFLLRVTNGVATLGEVDAASGQAALAGVPRQAHTRQRMRYPTCNAPNRVVTDQPLAVVTAR